MSYTVDSKTKYATYNGKSYGPRCVITQEISTANDDTKGKTIAVNTFVALSEDDCKEMEARRNAKPAKDLERLRRKRNSKLAKTDWMTNSDAPTMSTAWKNYRQALRDLPASADPKLDSNDDLINVTWPTKP